MILLKKLKLITYAVFSGLFLYFLIIFSIPLGIAQIFTILANISFCVIFYRLYKIISNRISFHSKIRDIYRTNKIVVVNIGKENNVRLKRIWKYEDIFLAKFFLGLLLLVALFYPFMYIFTYFHELSHAITALIYGSQIIEINILSPGIGYTTFTIIGSESAISHIFIAGSLGAIIFGSMFLLVIYRNKSMKLEGVISIYCLIGYVILSNILYLRESVLLKKGDGWNFLTYNPQLNPFWLANLFETIYWAAFFWLILFLATKIISQISSFLKEFFPDLSIYDC